MIPLLTPLDSRETLPLNNYNRSTKQERGSNKKYCTTSQLFKFSHDVTIMIRPRKLHPRTFRPRTIRPRMLYPNIFTSPYVSSLKCRDRFIPEETHGHRKCVCHVPGFIECATFGSHSFGLHQKMIMLSF